MLWEFQEPGPWKLLELEDADKAMKMWLDYSARYEFLQKPFEGIPETLQRLKDAGLRLGISNFQDQGRV